MPELILFMTDGCHLCEQAEILIGRTLGAAAVTVDIAGDEELFEHYGVRIPVLQRRDTGAELNWPFTAAQIKRLVAAEPDGDRLGDLAE